MLFSHSRFERSKIDLSRERLSRNVEKNAITMDFYHATDPDKVESIVSNGFQLPFVYDDHDGRIPLEGCLGQGVYVTRNWQTALWFGRALLRVQLVRGTRILDVGGLPHMKVIDSLKREFGKDVLSPHMTLHKVIPKKKKLTLNELVALTKYHFYRTWGESFWQTLGKSKRAHGASLQQCWSMLRRYKYDGFGHSTSDIGIMLLAREKVAFTELVAVASDKLTLGKLRFDSIDELRSHFKKNGEKKYKDLAERLKGM